MEDSAASIIEIDVELDTSLSPDQLWSPEDHRASASATVSALPWKHPYTIVAHETTPLLQNAERMSAQLSSPIEIAGIEGQDGADRPWLRALEAQRKKPWWETASVNVTAGNMLDWILTN